MKVNYFHALYCLFLISGMSACSPGNARPDIVQEGVIFSVEYLLENGRTGGFSRVNNSQAVPGGNGSWNVDAFGRLTRDFLIISWPQKPDLDELIIPAHRIVKIQFGTGGIESVNESQPMP